MPLEELADPTNEREKPIRWPEMCRIKPFKGLFAHSYIVLDEGRRDQSMFF